MERSLFSEEHEIFRKNFRQFVDTRVVPKQDKWRQQGVVDREVSTPPARLGLYAVADASR